MFGRYVTINCLYVEDPIKVWVICTPDTPLHELQNRAREIVLREMEKQLNECNLQPSK
ncbi:hypothetical protein [Tissierella sp.]|uniref:hypothetical protein n=1 Tax=Tissierella sp. TaxID=41274 RepID=UPI00286702EE|nr:hypothetical protein [Tissierella sp.]MDR7856031.1 hypothetical protein [Tissierella sp.]